MTWPQIASALLTAVGFVLALVIDDAVPIEPWLRTTLLVTFLGLGVGSGWVGMLQLGNFVASLALTVVTSLAVALLMATGLAVVGYWNPQFTLGALATLSLAGTVTWLLVAPGPEPEEELE